MASERDEGVNRIISFTDGVVAIALTLLVLPLTEIDPVQGGTLLDVVAENQGALFAFALSFAVIANYWSIHRTILGPLRRHSSGLILINMLWLAAIVFLPFPTSLIEDSVDGGFGSLYICALLAVSLLNLLLANHLVHHPELSDGQATAENQEHVIGSAFSVAALVIAFIISLFAPVLGMWALLLLFPSQIFAARLSRRHRQAE